MRKRFFIVSAVISISICVTACGSKELQGRESMQDGTEETTTAAAVETTLADVTTEPATELKMARMVMVDGDLYVDTQEEITMLRCGLFDGKIESSVDENKKPEKNGQSNFGCVGTGYQYAENNSIDIYLEEKWIRFKKEE